MKSKIAIIGISALFPESHTPEEFWQNLLAQKDVTTTSNTQDFGADPTLFFDTAKGKIDKCYSLKGGYIRDFRFDAKGYAVEKELLENVDEIFQWSLYVAAQALKDAGYFQNYDILEKCGIILGNLSFPTRSTHQISSAIYQNIFENHLQQKLGLPNFKLPSSKLKSDPIYLPRWSSSPTNLVSQALKLGGNHFALDAACATSLYAIKLACDQLLSQKADLMLAGAVSCADPLFIHMGFSIFQAYSESGKTSSPFDKQTGGLVSSEGAGMLVLKRYEDAIRDGDHIQAVISGIGLSNDGKGKFLLVPNPKGQLLAFERAYQESNIKPTDVQYIECHATGTPLGDITEINSISDFFDNSNDLPVGSVKSNIGHLLTAAGITSMVKVILSMKNNLIPATIKITEPIISYDQKISGKNIVQQHLAWENDHKVAAINSFGFGGTNAHLVLESAEKQLFNQEKIKFEATPMAIIGMDCHFGNCKNLEDFYLTIYEGKQQFIDLPEKRWKGMEINHLSQDFEIPNFDVPKGAYITDFEIDLLRFKIQPKEAEKLEPQQTLILKVAENALKNAGFNQASKNNVAVIVAMESEMAIHHYLERWDLGWQIREAVLNANIELSENDLNLLENTCKNLMYPSSQADNSASQHTSFIGNVMTARISSLWDFTGASFTISSGENSVLKALEVAQNLLSFGEVDAVVVGAVDLSGSFENVMLKAKDNPIAQKYSLSFEKSSQGWAVGEGAGVVILKRLADAKNDKDRIFAVIDDIEISQKPFKVETENIDYLELSASGLLGENELEMQMFPQSAERNCAVGSVKANIGHTFAAAGMAALIKTALCVYHRFIPAIPQWKMPFNPDFFAKTPFYFPVESRPWILENHQDKRKAAIQNLGADGTFGLIKLSEYEQESQSREHLLLKTSHEKLFLINANSESEMNANLHQFADQINSVSLDKLANQYFQKFKTSAFTLCLIAKDLASLKQEIAFAEKGIAQAFHTGKAFQSPQGSYFEANPLGKDAKIALVYPGAASAYVGLGKDLFQLFPTLLDEFTPIVPDVADVLRSKQLFPRHQSVIEGRGLRFDAISQMSIGSSFSALYTKIVQDHLQIKPAMALGYSMGEASTMWYSLGIWNALNINEVVYDSPLFNRRVAGSMECLQEFWEMSEEEVQNTWASFVVTAPVAHTKTLLAEQNEKNTNPKEKIYLTFINTPDESIISGNKEICIAFAKSVGLRHKEVKLNNVTHHEFVRSEYDLLIKMHHLPLEKQPNIDFYGGKPYGKLEWDSRKIAEACAELCFDTVDFVNQIETVYKDGGRIFLELGANANCSRWISSILANKAHLALSCNRKGGSDLNNLLAMVAKLVSNGVELNLALLYPKNDFFIHKNSQALQKKITLGGDRVQEKIMKLPDFQFVINDASKAEDQEFINQIPMNDLLILNTSPSESPKTDGTRIGENGLILQDYSDPNRLNDRKVIWNEADLREFAYGEIAKVFGKDYAIIDSYSRRVMLPKDPYLLVSRVTKLDGKKGEFKPSSMTTEYDIPYESWFATDGQIPWAVAVESGQCDLLLISYLGIDFEAKGELVYRLLDCTLTFLDDLPYEGQTLRYDISINNYARNGRNLLFFFSYNCYVEDRLVLTMRNGCAGFFSNQDLAGGQGVVPTKSEIEARKNAKKQSFAPLLHCNKTNFNKEELLHLVKGDIVKCFGDSYHPNGKNKSLRLPPEEILMLDRITKIDLKGGAWGLGEIIAEKDLKPEEWYFPCHFRDDQVLAGSLQAEGGGQLLRFVMLMLGMQRLTKDARFQPVFGLPQKVRCRREVTPNNKLLAYRMEIKEIGLVPYPYVIADLEIIADGTVVVFFENLGLQLREKSNPKYLEAKTDSFNGVFVPEKSKNSLLNEAQITEFALGAVKKCFGEEYAVFDGKPLSRQPNTDLQLMSRVLKIDGQRGVFKNKPTIYSEYDVPQNAWYYEQSKSKVMPYSVLMEIALQPCGFLGAYLGITLQYPDKDLFFRNLDGHGEMSGFQDFRGKTIHNKASMTTYVALGGSLIQKYDYELSIDNHVFYKGYASFGFFTKEDLSSQAGLDSGQFMPTFLEKENPAGVKKFNLSLPIVRKMLFEAKPNKPAYALSEDQLNLLDNLAVLENGGKYGKGYAYGNSAVQPSDWFFTCHFYQDPVMPGSLGVEAIFQAIQGYVLVNKIGEHLANPRFSQMDNHKIVWKYRGQILEHDPLMQVEVHIKSIQNVDNQIHILADASLWKGKLRIYEVTDCGLVVL